jgi:hypothetical protein
MSERKQAEQSYSERSERDGRAYIVASLLREGWSAQEVSRALKVIDGGGSPEQAMAALREDRRP